ncbi:hypothetical protein SASPL_127081 [Salvia splendens]|uniref:Reverse transcriptase Ty1/copia-type domain-containing protein n=1 Tax=Salvia splendens TaxID=180675 RepID=A0A8X8ZSB4_SALSN|nr:hypothetical protein SASPL_127081 [Salvia splendens]
MAAQTPDPLPVNTMINMTTVKLDSTTYLIWHRQMLHMAECFDLQGFLDGSVVAPPCYLTSDAGVSSPNPAYNPWRMKDRKLLSVAFSDSSASCTHQLREELLSLRCGSQYTSFADTRLALTPMPMFRDLLHQVKQFKSMLRAMDVLPTSPAAFSIERGRTTNEQHPSGSQNSNSIRLRSQVVVRVFVLTHHTAKYADKCPQFLNAHNVIPSAHLAEAFKAGASAHMTNQQSVLDSCAPYSGNGSIIVGNGNSLSISHIDSSKLTNDVQLLDVLVVPHITKNLLSISKLTSDYPVDVLFSDKSFVIQNRVTKSILAQGRRDKGLCLVDLGVPALVAALRSITLKASFSLWHLRLGHIPFHVISLLNKLGHLSISSLLSDPSVCSPCHLAKSKCLPFAINEKSATVVLELIHCDLWGPAPISTSDGYKASLPSASASPTSSVPTPSTLRPPPQHPSALLDDEEPDVPHQPKLSAHPEHVAQLQPKQPAPPATEPAAQVAPHVQHPMVTRARSGIYKRRYPDDLSYTALLSALVASSQPRGIKSATKSPAWSSAMQEEINSIHAYDTWDLIHKEFAIKDLGRLNYFLGLEVSYTHDGLFIGQAKYAHDILKRAELLDSKPVATPLSAGEVLVRDGSPFRDPTLYRSLVGVLQYLTITRPNLSYAVNLVSQFLQSPIDDHLQALKRIIRLLTSSPRVFHGQLLSFFDPSCVCAFIPRNA